MKTYLEMTLLKLLKVNNEKGAEVVEWVLWVGGIAVLAGAIYAVVNNSLSAKTTAIMNTIAPVTGS
jgi:Flp pilus assembly pilin Flp